MAILGNPAWYIEYDIGADKVENNQGDTVQAHPLKRFGFGLRDEPEEHGHSHYYRE